MLTPIHRNDPTTMLRLTIAGDFGCSQQCSCNDAAAYDAIT